MVIYYYFRFVSAILKMCEMWLPAILGIRQTMVSYDVGRGCVHTAGLVTQFLLWNDIFIAALSFSINSVVNRLCTKPFNWEKERVSDSSAANNIQSYHICQRYVRVL